MYISDTIIKKVEEKEKFNEDLKRCLNVLICPQCGTGLKAKDIGRENLIEIEYTCPKCQFTRTRPK